MKVQYVRDLVEGKKPDTVLHGILSNSCWKESLFLYGDEPQSAVHACMGRRLCGDREHRVRLAHEMEAA